jgi:hypothetical protein
MDLLKKLRIDTDKPLWLINIPSNCEYLFEELAIKKRTGKERPVPQLILFAASSTELTHYLPLLADHIVPETLFWIVYPKKSGALVSHMGQMSNWDFVFSSGYRPQTSVSINDDWTGLRVTNALPKKPSTYNIAPEERNIEGIDFVKRTVKLPADALAAMKGYKGMAAFFEAMAFTHKKEHVAAILDAKKEETRRRRIEKMIEMLHQKMHARSE